MRAGIGGSAVLLFFSLAVPEEMCRLEDRDIRNRQEQQVNTDRGRKSGENDMVVVLVRESYEDSVSFLGQNGVLYHQSVRLEF